jgi:hypothetical protein
MVSCSAGLASRFSTIRWPLIASGKKASLLMSFSIVNLIPSEPGPIVTDWAWEIAGPIITSIVPIKVSRQAAPSVGGFRKTLL